MRSILISKDKVRGFFCELFDSHEWIEYGKSFMQNHHRYINLKCVKCGKTKTEPAPAFILTPFYEL